MSSTIQAAVILFALNSVISGVMTVTLPANFTVDELIEYDDRTLPEILYQIWDRVLKYRVDKLSRELPVPAQFLDSDLVDHRDHKANKKTEILSNNQAEDILRKLYTVITSKPKITGQRIYS